MKKTQYQLIQEILNTNSSVPKEVLNEGILSAIVKGIKAVAKFANKVTKKQQKIVPVSTKKLEPRTTKPLATKKSRSPKKLPVAKKIPEPSGKIPHIKGVGSISQRALGTDIKVTPVEYRPGVTNLRNTYYDYLTKRFAKGRINTKMPNQMQLYFGWVLVDGLEKNFTDWDAYKLGIIDANGNELRKAKNSGERATWNYMLKAVASLKQNLEYAFKSQPKLNYMLRNLKQVKESKIIDHNDKHMEIMELMMNECQNLTEQYIDNLSNYENEEELNENINNQTDG
jgi:hypothetical protein